MDNPLTPNKIQRLIHLAEDRSFNLPRRLLLNDDDVNRFQTNQLHAQLSKSTVNCESSSGILDLDRVEGFGDSAIELGNESLCKSTAFNPGEITGRSTGADEMNMSMPLGRHSLALENITSQMNKQSDEVHEIMRHTIGNTSYSFHSKRDLTADEASLVMREAPLPIQPSTTQTHFADSISMNNSNVSVGAYFQKRCSDFGKMLQKTDSPDKYSAMPSITEVSPIQEDQIPAQMPQKYTLDESLDCVPVRQSRLDKLPEKLNINNPNAAKNYEKKSFHSSAALFEKTNDTYNKASAHDYSSVSKAPEPHTYAIPKALNPIASSSFASHKAHLASSSKPMDVLIRNMHASMRLITDDTEGSATPSENSLSISKIADYLGKESNISVTGILKYTNHKKPQPQKQPLTELQMNLQENIKHEQMHVTNLRDTRKMDTASSAGTVSTVISLDRNQLTEQLTVPEVVVTNYSNKEKAEDFKEKKRSTRSKSPSSKSQSTFSTVQENFISFKSGDSPILTSKGDVSDHVPSPNIEYRELDKSVDWNEVLQQKRLIQEGLAKEQWADIMSSSASGFVGVSCPVNITVTTLTDSWLTAKIQFHLPDDGKDLTIELPRLPLLLSPGKSEKFTLHITSNVEMNTKLPYTIFLKDASIDGDIEQKGELDIDIKMPVVQATSSSGINKVTFPPVQEKSWLMKSFVLISDCPVDLQLDLSVVEGDSIFTITNVQEIKKSDVNKVLMDRQGSLEEGPQGKKNKGLSKQLCRLSSGNAIKVTIKFNAPRLSELQIEESMVTFNGYLNVNLYGVNCVLRKVDLVAIVGTVNLVVNLPMNKLHLTNEISTVTLSNKGSIPGAWVVKFANTSADKFPFKVVPNKFDIRPGAGRQVALCYTGPEDTTAEATLVFEDVITGHKTSIEIAGGTEKPRSFPIRTNLNIMSFVRAGRKELSLKNSTNKKVHIRCHIIGEGFSIDLAGMESRGIYCLPFGPSECRPLPIMFSPVSNVPQMGCLHLAYDKNSNISRTVKLFGCGSGESLRWAGLVTYGDTALVRAATRQDVKLELYNKAAEPAFVCATVHFNLQYNAVSSSARLLGGRCVVAGRRRHSLALQLDWARVERRARDARTAALAAVSVLSGAELTRRRILRVLRDESTGVLDTSLLDDRLKFLAGPFEGEDPSMDNMLENFKENKESLNELIGGLHELTAQIVLPQDFADENTIIITDDTVVEHHTLSQVPVDKSLEGRNEPFHEIDNCTK